MAFRVILFLNLLACTTSARELATYKKGEAGARTFNPDILEETNKCMTTCLNDNRGVCQGGKLSETSYCCNDATDCKAYKDDIGDGFCSSFVTQPLAKQMACPYQDTKCGSYQFKTKQALQTAERNDENINQQKVSISSDGKDNLIKQSQYLGNGEFCFYEAAVTSASNDQFLSITFQRNSGMKQQVLIASTLDDQYVDLCTGVQNGDVLFARYPYKFFPIFESNTQRGVFQANVQFRGSKMDLPLTKNRFRCKRVQNKVGGQNYNTGSTVGGKFGYGYAQDSNNDQIGTVSPAPSVDTSSSTSSTSFNQGGGSGGTQQQDEQQQQNMNMDTENFTVQNNLVFQPLKISKFYFKSSREFKKNIISGNYAILISVTFACLVIACYILNTIKQNQVDIEIAKDRIRDTNVDGLFREEEAKEDENNESSSSSSFQDRNDQYEQDTRVQALNNQIQNVNRQRNSEVVSSNRNRNREERKRNDEERKDSRESGRGSREGGRASRPRRNANGQQSGSRESQNTTLNTIQHHGLSPNLDGQATQHMNDSSSEINNNFAAPSPEINLGRKKNKIQPLNEAPEPFASSLLDRDDIEDSTMLADHQVPVVTRENRGMGIKIGNLTNNN